MQGAILSEPGPAGTGPAQRRLLRTAAALLELVLHTDNGKEHGNYYNGLYRDYTGHILGYNIGIMEKENGNCYRVCWTYVGIMEKQMETAIEYIGVIQGYW